MSKIATKLYCFIDDIWKSKNVFAAGIYKPHIVMVDDWGWANIGYLRKTPTKEVVTPNFDSLSKQDLELDHHYAYQYCWSAFLTGRLPNHVNDRNMPLYMYNQKDPISGFGEIP